MMEMISGEAGVLRTALGVVLGMDGIDARVRLYLWSGGVEDAVLPTLNAARYPVGAQVIVTFLSDRTASGMVLGTVEGLLSWRRTAPPAFVERIQPHLQAAIARCHGLDPSLTVMENAFTLDPDDGQGLFCAAILLADGRVFFMPGQSGVRTAVIKPHIWDPHTGSMHQVEVPWEAGSGAEFGGGCLLQDGRVFLVPAWTSASAQAYVYDPELDRLTPAGEAVVTGYNSCVLLPDGRVLLIPWSATSPLLYDPRADTMTVSAAATPPELQTGADFTGGQLLPDGRVLLVPNQAPGALVYAPAADSLAVVAVDLGGASCGSGVLLPDGRVLLPISYGEGKTVIFDPETDSCPVTTPPSHPGGYHAGGALLADGRVLVVAGQNGDLVDCRIWDPADDTYAPVQEFLPVPAIGQGAYAGGCVLPAGRVVFTPWYSRHLVVWEPGLGASFGRDVALSGFWNRWP
ncbi:MAG: hypothetical protein U1E16_00045 [Hyphomicrobiales bacterium]